MRSSWIRNARPRSRSRVSETAALKVFASSL